MRDRIGRAIAESMSPKTSVVGVTLTYGGGDIPKALMLHYSDVQAYLRRLQHDIGPTRYLAAGEVGQKGRCHWHLILYLTEHQRIRRERATRIHCKWWTERKKPIGFAFYEDPADVAKSIAYAASYATKGLQKKGTERTIESVVQQSRHPPLGHAYFQKLAYEAALAGVPPMRDLRYSFPGNVSKKGKPFYYFLSGASARNYLAYYVDTFERVKGRYPSFKHERLERFLDEQED